MAGTTKVAITGAAGLVGGVLLRGLSGDYDITGLDLRTADEFEITIVDSGDVDALQAAFFGQDVVVDLASTVGGVLGWPQVYQNNLACTYNALQAAHAAGVRRLIFASSNHATGMYEGDQPYADVVAGRYAGLKPGGFDRIAADWPLRPDSPYGIAKAFGEAAGRYFADAFGLSVLCMRIGSVSPGNRPQNARSYATLLTHADLVWLVRCCIEAPAERLFGIYYGVSNNTWRFWDLANATDEIGFEPQDDAEQWRSAG